MSLQETIRRVLKEEVNESTFFIRRVDMSSLDENFEDNLDIVTDIFLNPPSKTLFIGKLTGRHMSNQSYNFNDFKDAVLSYIIEDFHYELTNLNGDDYPEDEVYEFLSNYFHDKIKDRYDTFFGNKINESVDKSKDKKLKLVTNFIYYMFDNVGVEYNSKDNEIMVYYDKQEELVPIEICDVINDFTGLNVIPWYEYDKNRIGKEPDFYLDSEGYNEELNENYSPAGKEITPNKIVVHKTSPVWRENILKTGLQVSTGDCYKTYVGYGEKCVPAIFATNSTNKRAWFDSTYDDDVWAINTESIPKVKWYKDRHFESTKKHIVTFENIPPKAIELIHEGNRKSLWRESIDKSEDKKLKILTKMIHEFFDEVSFIDIKKYENKPMIRVYFDNDEVAGNEETYFAEKIQDKVYEYTGIKLIPYWHTIQYNTDADFRLDAIKLKYDNEGNVINNP